MRLVLFVGVSLSASTVGRVTVGAGGGGVFVGFIVRGVAVSSSLRPWRCMFRAATQGEQRGGAASGMGGAVACAVRIFEDRRGGGNWRFVLVIKFICAVSEGAGGDRYSGVSTLVGGTARASLGVGDASRRGCGLLDATINFSGLG